MQKSCSDTFTSCYPRNGNIKAKLKTSEKWVTITLPDDLFKHGIIGVARGIKGAMAPPKYLENIVILCFERRFSKQNSVIRLKSNILVPPNSPPNFWAGYATVGNHWFN